MTRIRKATLLLIAFIITAPLLSHAECRSAIICDSTVLSFNFRHDDDLLIRDYKKNSQALDVMVQLMSPENITNISKITIIGSASPDGVTEANIRLAQRRAESVRNYIQWRWGESFNSVIQIAWQTDYLSEWIRSVEADLSVPRRGKVLDILSSDVSTQTKWANIQLLAGGVAEYMERNLFPSLRNAVSCIITLKEPNIHKNTSSDSIIIPADTISLVATDGKIAKDAQTTIDRDNYDPLVDHKSLITYRPLFALKTNLLFDIASLLNLEIEIPLGRHFSLAIEGTFPWWLWENKQHCLQMKNINLEARYWFGNRNNRNLNNNDPHSKRNVLTGWFVGLYANGGDYDLEWEGKGYQGEYFWASGVSGGFAHAINKRGNLRLEYSLGIGYMKTKYRYYEAVMESDNQWHLYRRNNGLLNWTGPTRAKISLVWMLGSKKKGGGK